MTEQSSPDQVIDANDWWCVKHRSEKLWADCWNCGGEGFSHHDCGEDCCACLYPEDNVVCDNCNGEGGYKLCPTCAPGAFDDY